MLYTTLQEKAKMDDLSKLILEESKKENMFVSEELSERLSVDYKKHANTDMYFVAVLTNKQIVINYIKLIKSKNRVKIKGFCDGFSAKELLMLAPTEISLYYKDTMINTFSLDEKNVDFSIKKKSENNYIVCFNIKKGE